MCPVSENNELDETVNKILKITEDNLGKVRDSLTISATCKFCGKNETGKKLYSDFCKECMTCPGCGSAEFSITHHGFQFSRCMICLTGWQNIKGEKEIFDDFLPAEEILKSIIAKSKTS